MPENSLLIDHSRVIVKVASFILHMFLYLESLAALDEVVGDAGEAVVGEVEHAQELQVLELAEEKERMLKGILGGGCLPKYKDRKTIYRQRQRQNLVEKTGERLSPRRLWLKWISSRVSSIPAIRAVRQSNCTGGIESSINSVETFKHQ